MSAAKPISSFRLYLKLRLKTRDVPVFELYIYSQFQYDGWGSESVQLRAAKEAVFTIEINIV